MLFLIEEPTELSSVMKILSCRNPSDLDEVRDYRDERKVEMISIWNETSGYFTGNASQISSPRAWNFLTALLWQLTSCSSLATELTVLCLCQNLCERWARPVSPLWVRVSMSVAACKAICWPLSNQRCWLESDRFSCTWKSSMRRMRSMV